MVSFLFDPWILFCCIHLGTHFFLILALVDSVCRRPSSSGYGDDVLQVATIYFPGRHYFLFEPANIIAFCQFVDEVMASE